MNKDEALKMALEALESWQKTCLDCGRSSEELGRATKPIHAIKEALAQPKQEPKHKYRRGDRLLCLETEEWCVIHISGTDRQWVKFPDSHIGVYTNEQVADMFELIPKEPEQEPVALPCCGYSDASAIKWNPYNKVVQCHNCGQVYTTPLQREPLTDEEIGDISKNYALSNPTTPLHFARAIEAAHGIKE